MFLAEPEVVACVGGHALETQFRVIRIEFAQKCVEREDTRAVDFIQAAFAQNWRVRRLDLWNQFARRFFRQVQFVLETSFLDGVCAEERVYRWRDERQRGFQDARDKVAVWRDARDPVLACIKFVDAFAFFENGMLATFGFAPQMQAIAYGEKFFLPVNVGWNNREQTRTFFRFAGDDLHHCKNIISDAAVLFCEFGLQYCFELLAQAHFFKAKEQFDDVLPRETGLTANRFVAVLKKFPQ